MKNEKWMYRITLVLITGLLAAPYSNELKSEVTSTNIEETVVKGLIQNFIHYGDLRQVASLEALLHPDFRVAVFMPGSSDLTILSKDVYLGLLRDKKIGGESRILKINKIDI